MDITDFSATETSKFNGLGPRVGMDARYDFGEAMAGFGIVGGASLAYYLGDTDLTVDTIESDATGEASPNIETATDNINNHSITNLRANLGIDYVYFFDNEELSTLGIEVGYMVDFYDDAIAGFQGVASLNGGEANSGVVQTSAVSTTNDPLTFSGPYVQLKGVF